MRFVSAALLALVLGLAYPAAPRGDVVDTYFGTVVPDPYRWMEEIDSPQTRAWVQAEAALSHDYLSAIPSRAAIYNHLRTIYNYEKHGAPFHFRNHYFFTHNSGLQNQSVIYTSNGLHGTPRILIDPNTLSADGTVSIGGTSYTEDGSLVAYGLQSSGSDWETWHVRSVDTGKDTSDLLQWTKFSDVAWLKDKSGFFYERYPEPKAGETFKAQSINQAIYFHTLGTPQSSDRLFYSRPDHPDWYLGMNVTRNGRYGLISVFNGTSPNNEVDYVDLRDPKRTVHPLFPINAAQFSEIDDSGNIAYFLTTQNAPNGKLIAVDLSRPALGRLNANTGRLVIPEKSNALVSVDLLGGQLIARYLQDGRSAVTAYTTTGRFIRKVALPGVGSVSGFSGRPNDRVAYYTFANYTTPTAIYAYTIATGKSVPYWKPRIAFDASKFSTKLVFYKSKDGTRVPLTVSARKDIVLDASNPAILYGYGGFDISSTPAFSTFIATWLQMGGIYAVANLRGGAEYGEAWHRAGMLAHKQNVFDDFIAAAQYLIAKKYTSTPKLAIKGESNGGLLVGAVEVQRPALFGAALPGVGVLDMLRYDQWTVGHGWVPEYGCATCSAEQFKTLLAYSPYQNVKVGTHYPPTLISTADHDDRVFPAHSFKFAAAMQHAQAGNAPILLRVDLKSGHGGGKPISKVFDDYADTYAFLVKNLNVAIPANF